VGYLSENARFSQIIFRFGTLPRLFVLWLAAGMMLSVGNAAWCQSLVPAEVLVQEGDASLISTVVAVYDPTVNGNGAVAALAQGTISLELIFKEGTGLVELNNYSYSIGAVTALQIGYDNAGNFTWIPTVAGYEPLFVNQTEILHPNDDVPGTAIEINDIRRPLLTPGGELWVWVRAANLDEFLLRSSDASNANLQIYLQQGDVINTGEIIDISLIFDVSPNGGKVMAIIRLVQVDDITTANDTRVIVREGGNELEVASEGGTIGSDTWTDFDSVAVNNSGENLVAGTSDAPGAVLAHFSGASLQSSVAEGDTVDGTVLGNSFGLMDLNESGEAAFMWNDAGGVDHLFMSCDPVAEGLGAARKILSEGDEIDLYLPGSLDRDGVADYTVTSFQPNAFGTRLALDDNGFVSLKAMLDGTTEAVIRVYTTCRVGSIVVEKQTIPDGNGKEFYFYGSMLPGNLSDGQTLVDHYVPAGNAEVIEDPLPPGWTLTGIFCDDTSTIDLGLQKATFNLAAGSTITCTFTNTLTLSPNMFEDNFESGGE